MKIIAFFALVLMGLPLFVGESEAAETYRLQKVADGLYAALVFSDGRVTSNAVVAIEEHGIVVAGAHFTQEGMNSLVGEIAKLTPLPLRQVILTHHHRGYNYFDFDLPKDVEVIATWQTWQALKAEYRQMTNSLALFDKGLTLQRGKLTIVLRNAEKGHSEGDVIVYFPNQGVLFASDLVFHNAVGFMGDGHLREWVADLQVLENIPATVVILGVGTVTDTSGITRFRMFLQDFSTEILRHLEKGETLLETKKTFALPAYAALPGYSTFMDVNIDRGYRQLQEK